MKHLKLLLIIALVAVIFNSCYKRDDCSFLKKNEASARAKIDTTICALNAEDYCYIDECEGCIIKDRVIVLYKNDVTEKEKFELRILNGVSSYQTPSCGDNRLELWKFDIDTSEDMIDVKQIITQTSNKSKGVRLQVENEFFISITEKLYIQRYIPYQMLSGEIYKFYNTNKNFNKDFVGSNTEYNIAVIDTGIDYGYFDFSNPKFKLYNTSLKSDCGDTSGWDFYTNTEDVRDYNGHGTNVVKVMTDELLKINKTNFNILPVKAFNRKGKGTYWSLLCAMNYINQFDDIHVINMSLGFKKISETKILEQFIDARKNKSLIIASSGNYGLNNDVAGNEHYPSSYSFNNIISVGGATIDCKMDNNDSIKCNVSQRKSPNYGPKSIDLLVDYNHKVEHPNGDSHYVWGTSFSAASLSGRLGEFYSLGDTPAILKQKLNEATMVSKTLSKDYVNGGKFLPTILETYQP